MRRAISQQAECSWDPASSGISLGTNVHSSVHTDSVQRDTSWLSGIRNKLSQLVGISEWLSQLGVPHHQTTQYTGTSASTSMPHKPSCEPSATMSDGYNSLLGTPDNEIFKFDSILLEECPTDSSYPTLDLGWMNMNYETATDTIHKQHFGPLKDLLTIGSPTASESHRFVSLGVLQPTWCDKCGDFILFGSVRQAVRCTGCNYTCHDKCRVLVTLTCPSSSSSSDSSDYHDAVQDGTLGTIPKGLFSPNHSPVKSAATLKEVPQTIDIDDMDMPPVEALKSISELHMDVDHRLEEEELLPDDLAKAIDEFNSGSTHGLTITLHEDGKTFSGDVHIHMNLTRPINVVSGEQPPTIYDVVNPGGDTNRSTIRTITSFFLPRHTVRTVHINSQMTSRQMIVTLLRKFRVADNPRKYALYECVTADDMTTRKLTRVRDHACPLRVALGWGPSSDNIFMLQENDPGDILWDAFEVPELENFLRILTLEQHQYNKQIRQKYETFRYCIDKELRERDVPVDDLDDVASLPQAPDPPSPKNEEPKEEPIYVNLPVRKCSPPTAL